MSTPGPDDPTAPSQPSAELGGLDPKGLLNAGLETVPPVTLPPRLVDSDATMAVSRPQSTQARQEAPELPLPEELTNLLPHGNYHVESFLGQGGMGAVYKGMQVRLKRPVAIKIMRRDFGRDHDFEARFEREAQAMAKLNHPNIVSVIDYGEAGPDYLYIVMELVDGADLMDVIRGGQMTQEMALSLLPQICDALQFAHDHGIVHRDIKPSNIMLTRNGRIKMADFGLAKRFDVESSFRTQTGTGMGTPDYAAPEQFSPNSPIDHRADIYALGVMIYQMITGQLPRGVWKPPSQRAEVAPQWDAIVSRAMQSDPCDRYQQASEVKTDVSSIPLVESRRSRQTAEVAAPAAPQPRALASTPTKSRAPLLLGLVTGAVVIALVAFFALKQPEESGRGRQTAEEAPSSSGTATPPRALASAPTPIAAPALPESGWQPLFTEAEWRKDEDGKREIKDGLFHLRNNAFEKAPASPDGAIRAQIRFRKDTSSPALVSRNGRSGSYKLSATTDKPGECKAVWLRFYPPGTSTGIELGKYSLPKPVNEGAVLHLELHTQGSHLRALVNGVAAIDVHDFRLTASGTWGVMANDAWFESVEVQPLPAAAAPAPALPESGWKPLFTEAEWQSTQGGREFRDGLLHLSSGQHFSKPQPSPNGAVRVSIHFREDTAVPTIFMRQIKGVGACKLTAKLGSPYIALQVSLPDGSQPPSVVLGTHTLPKPIQAGDKVQFELRVVGNDFTALVDGKVVIEGRNAHLKGAGEWGIRADNAWFESVEVQPLPAAVTPASIAAPALPESGWKPLFTDTEWRTSNEDHEFVEGLLHVKRLKFLPKAQQPSADGAIRAKVLIRKGAKDVCVFVRKTPATSGYKLMLRPQTGTVYLSRDEAGVSHSLGMQKFTPDSRQANDGVILELRAQGSHLTALVDSVVLIEAEDNTLNDPGEWGITATDAWFESVEVQPLPAAATPEIWEDLLHDPAKLELSGAWERSAEGLRLSGAASAKLRPLLAATRRDQAIRMRAVFGGIRPGLMVPAIAPYDRYQLFIRGDNSLVLDKAGTTNSHADLREFALPTRIRAGQEYELEMRVDGQTLSVKFNGQTLGTLTDVEFRDGRVQIANIDANGSPTLINKLEVLDLSLSEKGSPSPNLPVSKSSPAASPPGWNDWIAEKRRAGAFASHPQLRDEPTGLRITADPSAELFIGSTFRNGRVRISCVAPESGGEVPLFLRSKSEAGITGRYQVAVSKKSGIKIQLFHTPSGGEMKWTELKTWPLPKDFDWAREYALELAAMNDLLTVSLNGKEVGSVQDTKLTGAGSFGFSALKDTRITKVEYQSLDGSAAAAVSPTPNFPVSKSSALTFNGHRYQLISTPSTWAEAKAKAEAMGGHLATFTTEAEERWARETILRPLSTQESASTKAPDQLYWIGGTAAAQSKDFRWLSGEPVGKIGWRSGNPGWRERTDMPETKAVGTLFAASLVVMRPHPSGEWISVQQQSLLRSGFIIEWDDAGGTSSVSPAPNLPVSKSSDPKFPPGQWVKLFTKPEDLPAELRKPDSGVTWEDGWIRFGQKQRILKIPNSDAANFAVRARFVRGPTKEWNKIVLRGSGGKTPHYQMGYSDRLVVQKWIQTGEGNTLGNIDVPALAPGANYQLEFAAIGNRLIGRFGDSILKMASDDSLKRGEAHIYGAEDIRDIEVINLDGLPEAEALRLLGVDEQGKDLRGKTATPTPATATTKLVWRNALAEATLKAVIANADHTDKGYLLPPGNHWQFPPQPVRAGAIRVVGVTEAGSPNHLSLSFGLKGSGGHYQVFLSRKLDQCKLTYLKEGSPERRLAIKEGVRLADGQPYDLLLARFAGQFQILLNGQLILQAAEPDATARYLTLTFFGDTHARVQKVEYLSLDGLPDAEALRLLGVDEQGNDLRGKTETAK